MIVKVDEWKGRPSFSIWNAEDDEYPIISFTAGGKANAILRAIPELVQFCTEKGGEKGQAAAAEFYKHYAPVGVVPAPGPQKGNGGSKKLKIQVT
jgi:hypothetical protein